jgi:hypothetical protein
MLLGCNNDDQLYNDDLQNIDTAIKIAETICEEVSIAWFSDLLSKAEEDRLHMTHKGNYLGFVSIIKYQNRDIF